MLLRHIEWALEQLTTRSFSGEWADPSVFQDPRRDVASRVAQAVSYYPCNLLFVHRDADGQGYEVRRDEIIASLRSAGIAIPAVSVIPVRMTESWLLCDEVAIRTASGRPQGGARIPLPSIKGIEGVTDPKLTLENCLCIASEHSGRKLEVFRRGLPSLKYRVAELVNDFSVLKAVPAFNEFMSDLRAVLDGGDVQ